MASPVDTSAAATAVQLNLNGATDRKKRMKVRSLLKKFGFEKRSDANTGAITEALASCGVVVNPAIIRLGTDWQLDIDDWAYLTMEDSLPSRIDANDAALLPKTWNADGWFDRLQSLALRTEKEVENKFIIPLLVKLGYTEEERYDGMPCKASFGSRKTTLVIDFALHDFDESALKGQVLLIAEAKKEDRLTRPTELQNAFRQAKNYAMWTQCRHLLVTDGRTIVVYQILRAGQVDDHPVFECERQDLKDQFSKLYGKVSKPVLSRFYLNLVSAIVEMP